VKFYPAEYFIGPMDPDELFTIKFDAIRDNSQDFDKGDSESEHVCYCELKKRD
jgi:hypothetical protein